MIICGMLFLVPYFSSINETILGTTTAGDTAANTDPITAAEMRSIPKIYGANKKKAKISKLAGTKDIMIAGRPTFFRSSRFKDSPAFNNIMINAICLRSADIDKIDGSNKSNTYGPSTIPVINIPIMRGNLILWQIAAIDNPTKKIKASDVNINKSSFNNAEKLMPFHDKKLVEVISLISGLGYPMEELHFHKEVYLFFYFL